MISTRGVGHWSLSYHDIKYMYSCYLNSLLLSLSLFENGVRIPLQIWLRGK